MRTFDVTFAAGSAHFAWNGTVPDGRVTPVTGSLSIATDGGASTRCF